jgi:hypothetical protein
VPSLQRSTAAGAITAAIVAIYLVVGRSNHFLDYGFAGYLAILLVNRPSRRVAAGCGLIGVILLAWLGSPSWTQAPPAIGTLLAYLGIGGAVMLAVRSWWDPSSVRLLAVGSCVPGLMIVGALVMFRGGTPPLMDNNLLRMDEILFGGSHPSFALGRLVASVPPLRTILTIAYQALTLALIALLALACRYPAKISLKSALAAVVVPAALCNFAYILCPATGPRYVYAFPFGEQPAPLGAIHQFGVINATPSLHLTWALLLWVGSMRFSRKLAVGGFALVLLTILATLGLGEHYVVDLMAAVPFTLFLLATYAKRWRDAAFGLAGVVTWQLCARMLPANSVAAAWLSFALLLLFAASAVRLFHSVTAASGRGALESGERITPLRETDLAGDSIPAS